jgi:hypothetical protein
LEYSICKVLRSQYIMSLNRLFRSLCMVLTPVVLMSALVVSLSPVQVGASSHREAPLISSDPDADGTDFYMWIAPDAPNHVTFVANYIPFSAPEGAPNFNSFSPNVLYEINIDTVGDAKAHVKYQFQFSPLTRKSGGLNTFLYNLGAVTTLDDADLQATQTYTVTEVKTYGNTAPVSTVLKANIPVPPPNIGPKSTPDYAALTAAAVTAGTIGTGADQIKVFAGPRDDPFWVDLGSIFDLLSLRGQAAPIGYNIPSPGLDNVSGFNSYSLVLQVPISRILDSNAPAGETVIGGWTTASRRATRTLNGVGGLGSETYSGDYVQVSRLGMPLTNEAVLPVGLKDAFNVIDPSIDVVLYTAAPTSTLGPAGDILQKSVENPELGVLLCSLYGVPMPKAPTTGANKCNTPVDLNTPRSGRGDIFDIFLTGMSLASGQNFRIIAGTQPVTLTGPLNINKPTKGTNGSGAGIVPAEMLRLNTATLFRPGVTGSACSTTPSRLGVVGGDACGFPNGRRPIDDVVEIELLAVAGAAYTVLTGDTAAGFTFNPALVGVLTDSSDGNDKPFLSSFPYLAEPHSGVNHIHTNIYYTSLPRVYNNFSSRMQAE